MHVPTILFKIADLQELMCTNSREGFEFVCSASQQQRLPGTCMGWSGQAGGSLLSFWSDEASNSWSVHVMSVAQTLQAALVGGQRP